MMARCKRVYYLYEDGSIHLNPIVVGRCEQVIAYTKKEAESLHIFLAPHQVFAEIRTKKGRVLFVDKAALDRAGLHQHLHLGRRGGNTVEVVGYIPADALNGIIAYLNACIFMMVPSTIAAVGKLADAIYANAATTFDAGGTTAPLLIRCSVIPTHVTTDMQLYTDAEILNKVRPATELEGNGETPRPVDLRNSSTMRSISAAALAEANHILGAKPGNPQHIKLQKKLRNKIAREQGYEKFNGARLSHAEVLQTSLAWEKLQRTPEGDAN